MSPSVPKQRWNGWLSVNKLNDFLKLSVCELVHLCVCVRVRVCL